MPSMLGDAIAPMIGAGAGRGRHVRFDNGEINSRP